jgi:hypothetical protein
MYQVDELDRAQVGHDRKESFSVKTIQPNSNLSAVKPQKQNFLSEFFNFFTVGFGSSNMDDIDSDYDNLH